MNYKKNPLISLFKKSRITRIANPSLPSEPLTDENLPDYHSAIDGYCREFA